MQVRDSSISLDGISGGSSRGTAGFDGDDDGQVAVFKLTSEGSQAPSVACSGQLGK